MRVLFLNYEYPPLGGGAGNATEYLLKEYAKVPDLEVHLVTSSVDAEFHKVSVGEKVFVHSVPIGKSRETLHFQSVFDLLRYSWGGYRYARKLLKEEGDFDVIHAFFSVPCGVQAYFLGRRFGLPYIVSLRGADVPGYSERFSFLYVFLRPFIRHLWKRAAFVVSNSSGLKNLALQTNQKQAIAIIPNGVSTQEFRVGTSEDRSDVFTLLCVSRLTPRKGIRYLIQAMKLLAEEGLDEKKVKLQVIGDGHERESLKALSQEAGLTNVEFVGRVPHEHIAPYYVRASAFVLPSLNEGMSNTMLEALASGLPLLATVTGGTEELLTDGENGFFLEMKSAEDIARKVKRLLDDRQLCERFAFSSRKRAEELSWCNVAASYIDLYRQS